MYIDMPSTRSENKKDGAAEDKVDMKSVLEISYDERGGWRW